MTNYNRDIVAWSKEQAAFIRAGKFDQLDLEHLADEIEDVGKSELREFENRMSLLLAHLIKWKYQPERRGSSWQLTIKDQRAMISRRLCKTPSLSQFLSDDDFWSESWADGRRIAENETGILNFFPQDLPWSFSQVMDADFWPD